MAKIDYRQPVLYRTREEIEAEILRMAGLWTEWLEGHAWPDHDTSAAPIRAAIAEDGHPRQASVDPTEEVVVGQKVVSIDIAGGFVLDIPGKILKEFRSRMQSKDLLMRIRQFLKQEPGSASAQVVREP